MVSKAAHKSIRTRNDHYTILLWGGSWCEGMTFRNATNGGLNYSINIKSMLVTVRIRLKYELHTLWIEHNMIQTSSTVSSVEMSVKYSRRTE